MFTKVLLFIQISCSHPARAVYRLNLLAVRRKFCEFMRLLKPLYGVLKKLGLRVVDVFAKLPVIKQFPQHIFYIGHGMGLLKIALHA